MQHLRGLVQSWIYIWFFSEHFVSLHPVHPEHPHPHPQSRLRLVERIANMTHAPSDSKMATAKISINIFLEFFEK